MGSGHSPGHRYRTRCPHPTPNKKINLGPGPWALGLAWPVDATRQPSAQPHPKRSTFGLGLGLLARPGPWIPHLRPPPNPIQRGQRWAQAQALGSGPGPGRRYRAPGLRPTPSTEVNLGPVPWALGPSRAAGSAPHTPAQPHPKKSTLGAGPWALGPAWAVGTEPQACARPHPKEVNLRPGLWSLRPARAAGSGPGPGITHKNMFPPGPGPGPARTRTTKKYARLSPGPGPAHTGIVKQISVFEQDPRPSPAPTRITGARARALHTGPTRMGITEKYKFPVWARARAIPAQESQHKNASFLQARARALTG